MKYQLVTILLSFLLVSCGGAIVKKEHVMIMGGGQRQFASSDAEFEEYEKEFEAVGKRELQDSNFSTGDIPINFGDTKSKTFKAVCLKYANGDKEVIVDKSWWDSNKDKYSRKSIIFHELGHCRLNRDHKNEKLKANSRLIKNSLMNEFIVRGDRFKKYESGYVAELFSKNDQGLKKSLQNSM